MCFVNPTYMKMFRNLLFAAAGMMLFAACGNADYSKTKSGLVYKIYNKGGAPLKPGQFLKVHIKAMAGDSVLTNTYASFPAYGQYDSSQQDTHDFIDILGKMKVGDSAIFVRSVDTLVKRGMMAYNPLFKKGGTINGSITILDAFETREEMTGDQENEVTAIRENEVRNLEEFLKKNNISNAVKTENGVFVVIDRQGDGPKVEDGTLVSVFYTGKLKDGTVFDSNVDSSFGHTEVLKFPVGAGQVIPGWDEGLKEFNKGAKGKIYIPSMMAYGPAAQGDKIPAFSDLVFDIEVVGLEVPSSNSPGGGSN